MKKILTSDDAVSQVKDGDSVMLGGFMCCGQPLGLVDALIRKNASKLVLISNDGGLPGTGVAKLIEQKRVAHLIASHIGLNPAAGQQMHSGEMKVELVPQGTLAEKIRCAGAGLGGVLTPTGIGTEVENGKQKIAVEGKDYLLETPLSADFALIKADVCDKFGNCFIAKAQKNFNIVMAMAARHTIVEAAEVVEIGQLDPDKANLPGVFVHAIVKAEAKK